jgi:hypothetical protein
MDNYVIWNSEPVPHECVLKDFTGFDATNTLFHGIPLAKAFPPGAAFHMDPDFPNDLLLTDNLLNTDACMVVSSRLADALKMQGVEHLEYLPVRIIDHKGKVASKDYFVLNSLELVDCIDREKSKFTENAIVPGRISRFEKLVIDESRIPADRPLFRMKDFARIALATKALANALNREKFAGLGWLPISEYP